MPLILLAGDNRLEIGEALRVVREPFNPADVLTFDGVTAPLASISEACRTAGLFDPGRLVVVQNLHDRVKGAGKEAGLAEVASLLSSIAPTVTLVLVSPDMQPDHPLVKSVRSTGGQIRFHSTPKRQDLRGWIAARAKRKGIAIRPDATELLAELAGANPSLLDSEMDKLATYAGRGETVTPEMVSELVGAVPQESIFALVDAIASGNSPQAFRLLHGQISRASSQPIDLALYLIRMLVRQVRILLRINLFQEAGKTNASIVSELRLPTYYADRYFRQARRLPKSRLIAAFHSLATLEHRLKSGQADPATGLDLLVAELCG